MRVVDREVRLPVLLLVALLCASATFALGVAACVVDAPRIVGAP